MVRAGASGGACDSAGKEDGYTCAARCECVDERPEAVAGHGRPSLLAPRLDAPAIESAIATAHGERLQPFARREGNASFDLGQLSQAALTGDGGRERRCSDPQKNEGDEQLDERESRTAGVHAAQAATIPGQRIIDASLASASQRTEST